MKRVLYAGLIIFLMTSAGCSTTPKTEAQKQENVIASEAVVLETDGVDLNQEKFADIYHLSSNAEVDEIYVYSHILKKPRNLNDERVEFEDFKSFYGLLLTTVCKNSTQNDADFYDNPIEYTIDFRIGDGEQEMLFHIEFGKAYLLVNLKGVNTYAYKHELSLDQYETLKKLINETPPTLDHSSITSPVTPPIITYEALGKIEADMTYRQVVDALGEGVDIGSGVYVFLYQMEDGKPFVLSVMNWSDEIMRSGKELIEEIQ